ncbi:hypothetical protein HKCCE2091_16730 [Rhodobacterales bacterium HKCCE2091]|nr:hypothetical protein [Rhodobacterales bacterium HKCCE2091]
MTNEGPLTDPSEGNEPETPARFPIGPDFLIAIGVLVFAGAVYYVTTTFHTVPRALVRGMQPAVYPRFLVGAMVVLALILAFAAWRRRGTDTWQPAPPILTLYTAIALVATVALLPTLGLLPVLVLFCAVLPVLWGQRNPIAIGAFAVIFPLIVYGLFGGLLGVRFPAGILSGIL